MEKPDFLDKKYQDLTGSKPVERAVRKARLDPERKKAPHSRDERIQAYLDRIDKIITDESGWELLKAKIIKEFAIDTDDEETLAKIAHGLFESEKRLAIEQGRGADIDNLENSGEDILEKYRGLVREKRDIQERTLSSWLEYLHQNDAEYPTWFRYFVVRNLQRMGTLDKEKGEYSKRNDMTVAPFPELNSEALGFVYRMLTTGIGSNEYVPIPEDSKQEVEEKNKKREELDRLIAKKDFVKLYTFAQIETAGSLNRESLKGEWVRFPQGSDYHQLENVLRGKGTGWCTAEGSASAHLKHGDFYVYFTLGGSGRYTEPRIAVRMEGESVAEVRGVNHRQELEPVLVDIAAEKYHSLPGGEKFDKKSSDMKKMTELSKKEEKGEPFNKDDLVFLYEMNAPIEGFGYDKDPRIKALRKKRNLSEDLPVFFECSPEQIAYKKEDIDENTKAYIGEWNPKVLALLPNGMTNVYENFPDKKILLKTIETDPKIQTAKDAEKIILDNGHHMGPYTKSILEKTPFSKERKTYELVSFSVAQLGFPNGAKLEDIYERARGLGLDLCPAEVGSHLRLQYKDQPYGEYLLIAMNIIIAWGGFPRLFRVNRNLGGSWLEDDWAEPNREWDYDDRFVFLRRKSS